MKPLHKIAGIKSDKPPYRFIQVKNNTVTALDGFGFVQMPVDMVFNEGVIEQSEELYFSAEQWQTQKADKAIRFVRDGMLFKIFDSKKQIGLLQAVLKNEIDGSFPDVETVKPINRPELETSEITINYEVFHRVCSAFGGSFKVFKLKFYSGTHGKPISVMPNVDNFKGYGQMMAI